MMRGVSASKEDVHNAIKNIDKGIFPQAFCKIIPDILGGDPEYCNIMHADGAGTKSSLAYMYWKETGDLGVWKGIAQDALIMNIDDLLCVGAVDNILVSSTIGRNKLLIPGEVISAIINGTDELLAELREMAEIPIIFLTALNSTADIVKGFQVGGNDFISKPFNKEELSLSRPMIVLRNSSVCATMILFAATKCG
jgi:hypothetical protein